MHYRRLAKQKKIYETRTVEHSGVESRKFINATTEQFVCSTNTVQYCTKMKYGTRQGCASSFSVAKSKRGGAAAQARVVWIELNDRFRSRFSRITLEWKTFTNPVSTTTISSHPTLVFSCYQRPGHISRKPGRVLTRRPFRSIERPRPSPGV